MQELRKRYGWESGCICLILPHRQASDKPIQRPAHLGWSRTALGGLTYLITDKGLKRQWLKEIGKIEDASCVCDGWSSQNAAYLYTCPWVRDGRGRTRELAYKDEVWCEAVARFIR